MVSFSLTVSSLEYGSIFSKKLENVYKKFVINYFKRLLVKGENRF